MDTEKYLRRFGIENFEISANAESLKILQQQHLLNVPFENLDIHWKRPILLDLARIYEKIVNERRGGFCYELNGLFCELLNRIGFPSRMVSARVAMADDEFSREFDHMAILTEVGGETFLVDVGFGDFTAEPLKFELDAEQSDASGVFTIKKHADEYFLVAKKDGDAWKSEYIFKDVAHDLAEYAEMCEFHQTSPESHFTQGKVCSLMLANGRKTLTNKKFIETRGGVKNETDINSEDEFNDLLAREFEIDRLIKRTET